MNGMGDRGHNTGVIADLWAKILQSLLKEVRAGDAEHVGTTTETITAKNEQPRSTDDDDDDPSQTTIPQEWMNIWIPSLAQSLVSVELSRRRQVAAFCLPRIATMVGGNDNSSTTRTKLRSEMALLFRALLHQIDELQLSSSCPSHVVVEGDGRPDVVVVSQYRESLEDRILWAVLEIIRYANQACSTTTTTQELGSSVATLLPIGRLQYALAHSSPTIRVAALQVMESVVATYSPSPAGAAAVGDDDDSDYDGSYQTAQRELELWKQTLPFAVKTEGKEYISSVLQCLFTFLDRLSLSEAAAACEAEHNANSANATSSGAEVFYCGFSLVRFAGEANCLSGDCGLQGSFCTGAFGMCRCLCLPKPPAGAQQQTFSKDEPNFHAQKAGCGRKRNGRSAKSFVGPRGVCFSAFSPAFDLG